MPNVLKQITTKAKKIYKRGGTWKAAIKKAGAAFRAKKKRAPAKRRKKAVARKRIIHRVKKLHSAEGRAIKSLGSVSSHLAAARSQLKEQIGWAEAQKFAANKKSAKRKISKHIARLKTQFRKLC